MYMGKATPVWQLSLSHRCHHCVTKFSPSGTTSTKYVSISNMSMLTKTSAFINDMYIYKYLKVEKINFPLGYLAL